MKKILKRILNNYWKIQLLLFKFIDSNGFRIIGRFVQCIFTISILIIAAIDCTL